MASDSSDTRLSRIVECAETFFEQKIAKVTALAGEGGSSFRLHLPDRNVIATWRPDFRQTQFEASVLQSLSRYCDDVPEYLGLVDETLFQSDAGTRRLSQDIVRHDKPGQLDLAAEAVVGIFRFQSAARKTTLAKTLPHPGASDGWVRNFVHAAEALQPYSDGISDHFDRDAACAKIAQPMQQFVKWNCRSGKAAIGADNRLRWFDFSNAGMRHGAEDFAWLLGDETWPLDPDVMVDVMIDAFDPQCGHDISDYLEYLSVYLTFHCIQRFNLIVQQARQRGWLSRDRIRKCDDAGIHPEFAVHVCKVGSYFSAQSRITAPLTRNFNGASHAFQEIHRNGTSLKSACSC